VAPPVPAASSASFAVIATAALTSAGVSVLSMWLWSQGLARSESPSRTVVSTASAQTQAVLEARLFEEPHSLTAVVAPQQPVIPTRPSATPAEAVPAEPTPLPAARQAAAVPSAPKPRPPAPAPVTPEPVARPAAPTPAAALSPVSASAAAGDAGTQATGTSGAAGLLVITEPEGARVTVNGVGWGTTPVAIPYLPSGSKRVRVTKSGYESEERLVEPGAVQSGATVRIELRESPAGRLPQ
jgi:hypothetical protein